MRSCIAAAALCARRRTQCARAMPHSGAAGAARPSSRGAGAQPPAGQMERCLFPLTGVRIGLWTPHSAWSAFLLTLPASQRFVVLLTRNDGRRVRARARAVLSTACVLMCCCYLFAFGIYHRPPLYVRVHKSLILAFFLSPCPSPHPRHQHHTAPRRPRRAAQVGRRAAAARAQPVCRRGRRRRRRVRGRLARRRRPRLRGAAHGGRAPRARGAAPRQARLRDGERRGEGGRGKERRGAPRIVCAPAFAH